MPTKRKRVTRGSAVSEDVLCVLGIGSGINHMPDEELKLLWQEYGERVTEIWRRDFGQDPMVFDIARRAGWNKKR